MDNQLSPGPEEPAFIQNAASLELSANQTTLGFERTLMSSDATLMSIVRTSLSLIGFGFTIYTVFQKLYEEKVLHLNPQSAENFGTALILMAIALIGIFAYARLLGSRTIEEYL